MGIFSKLFGQKEVQLPSTYQKIKNENDYQEALLSQLNREVAIAKNNNDVIALQNAYEKAFIQSSPPCVTSQVFDLVDLYIKNGDNNKAWGFLNHLILQYPDKIGRIRSLQYKILKKEQKYGEALHMLALSHYHKNVGAYTVSGDQFIKEATILLKKMKADVNIAESIWQSIEHELKAPKGSDSKVTDAVKKLLKDII